MNELNLWASQWRAERIAKARSDFREHDQAWQSLKGKDTDYARSLKMVRDTCEKVLAVWESSPVDVAASLHVQEHAQEGEKKLWLWRNFVDGRPEYWAFDNPYPVHMDCGDPQTLGEPCGYALFKPSRQGRTDVSEEQVIARIKGAK